MNRLQRAALLTELADQLSREGSWCGETRLQKATYFLQALLSVPIGYEFILYKHGPFSFDLRDELTALQADGLMELRPRPTPYGPSLVPTPASARFREGYQVTLGRYRGAVAFVARRLGRKDVVELERLATALFITREAVAGPSPAARARRLTELKPHVAPEQAMTAVQELDRMAEEASAQH